MQNLVSFSTTFTFEPPAFANAARYPTSETNMQCCDDRLMPRHLGEVGLRTPE